MASPRILAIAASTDKPRGATRAWRMLTPEQLRVRREGVTSTDITKIVGVSPFGNACDVYADKLSDEPPRPSTIAQRMGDLLEPLVCELVAEEFSLRDMQPGRTVRNSVLPWLIATPDRFVVDTKGDALIEAKVKSVSFARRHEWDDDEAPPPHVHVQCAWHMIAKDVERCYVGALLGPLPRFYIVEHDPELASALIDAGQDFYTRHMRPRVPPPDAGSKGAGRVVAAVWPRDRAGVVKAGPEAEAWARLYFEAAQREKAAAENKEQAKQELCRLIEDHEEMGGGGDPNWQI